MKRFFAVFLALTFALVALPTMLIFSFSRTFFEPTFYTTDTLNLSYSFLLERSVELIREQSDYLKSKYDSEELVFEISKVFSLDLYAGMVGEVTEGLKQIQGGEIVPLTLSLTPFREALLSVANTLIYKTYQELPTCLDNQVDLDRLIPVCVPQNADYEMVYKPLVAEFERAIYGALPENIAGLERVLPVNLLMQIDNLRLILLIALLINLTLIVLVVYRPLSGMLFYLSLAFGMAGAFGLLLAAFFEKFIYWLAGGELFEQLGQELTSFLFKLLSFSGNEVQRLAIIFGVVGLTLLVLSYILKITIDKSKVNYSS